LASIGQGLHEVILSLPLHPVLNGLEICDPAFGLLALRARWAQHIGSSRAGREDSAGACSTSFAGAIGLKILVLTAFA
jgi:hypothetical protein